MFRPPGLQSNHTGGVETEVDTGSNGNGLQNVCAILCRAAAIERRSRAHKQLHAEKSSSFDASPLKSWAFGEPVLPPYPVNELVDKHIEPPTHNAVVPRELKGVFVFRPTKPKPLSALKRNLAFRF